MSEFLIMLRNVLLFVALAIPGYILIKTKLMDGKASGVLSKVLNTIACEHGSVLTINQGIPLQGVANATISIETIDLIIDLEALLDKLRLIEGVKRIEVLGQE